MFTEKNCFFVSSYEDICLHGTKYFSLEKIGITTVFVIRLMEKYYF